MGRLLQQQEAGKFFIVGTVYFTKWIEAEPTTKIKASQVWKFIWQNIGARFKIPMAIAFDHCVQFDCRPIQAFLTDQSKGQAEAANKQILNALKKKLNEFKGGWADMVSCTLGK